MKFIDNVKISIRRLHDPELVALKESVDKEYTRRFENLKNNDKLTGVSG